MEIKSEVKVYKVDYQCVKCEKGVLLPTGEMLMTYPAKYPHKCSNNECNHKTVFNITYPAMRYE